MKKSLKVVAAVVTALSLFLVSCDNSAGDTPTTPVENAGENAGENTQ